MFHVLLVPVYQVVFGKYDLLVGRSDASICSISILFVRISVDSVCSICPSYEYCKNNRYAGYLLPGTRFVRCTAEF